MTSLFTLAALLATVLLAAPARALDISDCYASVPPNTTAVLLNDIECDLGIPGVTLDARATLDLNGHSITMTSPNSTAVHCYRSVCTVLSTAATAGQILGTGVASIGIGNNGGGYPLRRVVVRNVSLQDLATGIRAADALVLATDVTATNCQIAGLHGKRFKVENVTANDNGLDGVSSQVAVAGANLTVNGNDYGIRTRRVRLTGLQATGNNQGVAADVVLLRESSLTGNAVYDIGTVVRRPLLYDTACDRSENLGTIGDDSWGVCALD